MRREHGTIVVEVLDQAWRLLQRPGPFHITALASRANLPHDRLRSYLEELASMRLMDLEPIPRVTAKGREFLDCYHAWLRIQRLYGLEAVPSREAPAALGPPPLSAPGESSLAGPALPLADGPGQAPAVPAPLPHV